MKDWLFIYYFITLIFLINKINSVNKKLQKSFDQIFGEGWKEREQMAEQNLDDKHKNDDGSDKSENYQQKREIIRKFRAIKEKVKQKGKKYSTKEWNKIDRTIARKLSTTRSKIYEWIKEFGMGKQKIKLNNYSDQQKGEIIRKFNEIKEKIKEKRKHSRKEWAKIDSILAKKLGTNQRYIYIWKNELGMKCREIIKDKTKKIEIVQKFDEIKNAYEQKGRHSRKEWAQKYAEITKKLGVCERTIQRWKKKFAMCRKRKIYSNEEELGIMRRYWEMKRINPKISERTIAKTLQIERMSLRKWKGKFRNE